MKRQVRIRRSLCHPAGTRQEARPEAQSRRSVKVVIRLRFKASVDRGWGVQNEPGFHLNCAGFGLHHQNDLVARHTYTFMAVSRLTRPGRHAPDAIMRQIRKFDKEGAVADLFR